MTRIVKTITIEAPPLVVWEYLTTKDKMHLWFDDLEADMVEGEDWCMLVGTSEPRGRMWGKVMEANPPERLVYSFNHDWMNHDTLVTWELKAVDGATLLTLTHTGFEGAEDADYQVKGHSKGWDDHLAQLAEVCRTG